VNLRESKWSWNTSWSTNISGQVFTGGVGRLYLKDPDGAGVTYYYAQGGVGKSKAFSKLPKKQSFTLGGSPKQAPNAGLIYMLPEAKGKELDWDDFKGFCYAIEASLSIIPVKGRSLGVSATAMLLGIDTEDFFKTSLLRFVPGLNAVVTVGDLLNYIGESDWIPSQFKSKPKALLLIGGPGGSSGGASVGASTTVGIVGMESDVEMPIPSDYVTGGSPEELDVHVEHSPIIYDDNFIPLPGDVLFDFDKDVIKSAADRPLQTAGNKIQTYMGLRPRRVQIVGYTDNIGPRPYNMDLSRRRANAVKNWLVQRKYVQPQSVTTEGRGPDDPVAENKTDQGRAQNRRVVINLMG